MITLFNLLMSFMIYGVTIYLTLRGIRALESIARSIDERTRESQ